MLEAIVVETYKQHFGIRVTQSPNASITTIGVEMGVALAYILLEREH